MGVVVCAVGCSGTASSGGPPPSAGPIAQADFAAAYVGAACGALTTCCAALGASVDQQACPGWLEQYRPTAYSLYDAARAGECVALYRSIGDTCSASRPLEDQIKKICSYVHAGNQPVGAPCAEDTDCAASFDGATRCNNGPSVSGPSAPTCVRVPQGSRGDSCSGSPPALGTTEISDCATGLYCSALSVCEPTIPAGQPCGPNGGCDEGLLCVAGVCGAKLGNGASCILDAQCASGTCSADRCAASVPITQASCAPSSTP